MKHIILITLLFLSLSAKTITPNDVYAQSMLITDEIHSLLKFYGINHDHAAIVKRVKIATKLKPRNTWQMTYEIMIKINILREEHNLPFIEPINMSPVLQLNPNLVYEQTQRILTELNIYKTMKHITTTKNKLKTYRGKTSIDVYNSLAHISLSFDELNKGVISPSYIFGEQMRVYNDITSILQQLQIVDKTIPKKKIISATSADVFKKTMNILEKIKQLQISTGIAIVDFSEFKKGDESASEIYTVTQMVIAELQTIKAYLKIEKITPAAIKYNTKTAAEVDQLVSWNFRKLNLIHSLRKGR